MALTQANSSEADAGDALAFAVRIACVALLFTLIVSWRFYTPGRRLFSPAPLLDFMASLPAPVDWAVYFSCLVFALWLVADPDRRFAAFGIAFCELFWVFQDVNRLQPYNYMYGYTILVAVLCCRRAEIGQGALRLMVSGVYFWAGFHKLNVTFYSNVFPWFIQPLHNFSAAAEPSALDLLFGLALFVTPMFEASIGVLLLFPRWRRLATAMAFAMLMVVLICLGPFGHDWGMIVWPWNVYLFALEFRLFFPSDGATEPSFAALRSRPLCQLSVFLFIIAPALAMFTPWYAFPGFKLYSGNIVSGDVLLAPQETLSKAPFYMKELVGSDRQLNLVEWAVEELKNAPYSVPQVFIASARGLCPYLDDPAGARLRIRAPAPFYTMQRQEEVRPLCK